MNRYWTVLWFQFELSSDPRFGAHTRSSELSWYFCLLLLFLLLAMMSHPLLCLCHFRCLTHVFFSFSGNRRITVLRRRACALTRDVRPFHVRTTRNVRMRQYNMRNVRKIVRTRTGQDGRVSGNGKKRRKTVSLAAKIRENLENLQKNRL